MDNISTSSSDDTQAIFGTATLLFLVGFVIGSRRWDLVTQSGNRLVAELGTIALEHAVDSFRSSTEQFSSGTSSSSRGKKSA